MVTKKKMSKKELRFQKYLMTSSGKPIELYPLFKSYAILASLINVKGEAAILDLPLKGLKGYNPKMPNVPFPKWDEVTKSYTIYRVTGIVHSEYALPALDSDMSVKLEVPGITSMEIQEYQKIFLQDSDVSVTILPKGTIESIRGTQIRFNYTNESNVACTEIFNIEYLLEMARKNSKVRKYKSIIKEAFENGSEVVPMIGERGGVASLAIVGGRFLDIGFLPQDFN